jgi:ribosomal protein S18 acetylase RimI-like enzyme
LAWIAAQIQMTSEIATEEDAQSLSDLVNAAYRGTGGQHGWTHESDLISGDRVRSSDVAAMINGGSTIVLVRRSGSPPAPLACVAVKMNDANSCTISMLAVAPDLQAGGLGRSMLADAEQLAASRGATIARMTVVRQRDTLLAWYERLGYRRTGYEPFPYGDDSVGTPLRGDLQFVILEKAL